MRIAEGDWAGLVAVCEADELAGGANDTKVAIHLAAYLAVGDTNNARFLWKRTAENVKAGSNELGPLWEIGKAMWKREHGNVIAAATALEWPAPLSMVVDAIVANSRAQTMNLVSRAYTSISVAAAAAKLGLSEADTIALATEAGWVHEGDYLAPTVAESDKKQTVNLDQLTELSNYVVYLESTPVSAKVASS